MIEAISSSLPIINNTGMTVKNINNTDDFKNIMKSEVLGVNEEMLKSEKMIENFTLGYEKDLPAVMSAIGKAKMSFEMMMQIRSHLVDGYKEIIRMQV